MLKWLSIAAFAMGCKKPPGDDCQRFVDKAGNVMKEMMEKSGLHPNADDKAKFLAACRSHVEKVRNDPVTKCVFDAKDDGAVRSCFAGTIGDYTHKWEMSEPRWQLERLSNVAKRMFAAQGKYPVGSAGPTPSQPCCPQSNRKQCEPTQEWASVPVWSTLGFRIDERTYFRYVYESVDGATATAAAIGDLDCDGTEITYKLELTSDGGPNARFIGPPPDSD